jgi:hypothetical protein
MAMFRNVNFGSENAIANLNDGKTKLVKNKELGSIFSRLGRSGAERAQNNAARTELLRSLGRAFGLSGMSESDGKTRFSAEFMKKLETILGREVLKTADFKIDADGTVSSGRPLTQRRIKAILNRAILMNPGEYNYDDYKIKLDYVRTRLDAMKTAENKSSIEGAKAKFDLVERMMNFVKDDLPKLIDDNDDYLYDKEANPYVLRMAFKSVPLTSLSRVNEYVQKKLGAPFHLSENVIPQSEMRNKIVASLDELTDPKSQIIGYYDRVMKSYVTATLDTFIECEKLDKMDAYIKELNGTAICVEAKTSDLIDFKLKTISPEEGPVATHNNDQPLDQCIGRIISAMIKAKPELMESEDFKDFAAEVKKDLVGTIRPITEPRNEPGGIKFRPVLDEKGKPVVRVITEDDIDRIGQACIDVINGA